MPPIRNSDWKWKRKDGTDNEYWVVIDTDGLTYHVADTNPNAGSGYGGYTVQSFEEFHEKGPLFDMPTVLTSAVGAGITMYSAERRRLSEVSSLPFDPAWLTYLAQSFGRMFGRYRVVIISENDAVCADHRERKQANELAVVRSAEGKEVHIFAPPDFRLIWSSNQP